MMEKNKYTLEQKMKAYAKPIEITDKNGVFKRRHLFRKIKRV